MCEGKTQERSQGKERVATRVRSNRGRQLGPREGTHTGKGWLEGLYQLAWKLPREKIT